MAVAEELEPLRDLTQARGWTLKLLDPTSFVLGLVAKDDEAYWLKVCCDQYPALPPAWHWYEPESGQCGLAQATPKGAGYFHGNGVICAPWNRLAYRTQDPRGPHGDWMIGDWRSNPRTGACKTLASMALKIACQLKTAEYHGRKGAK